MRIALIAALALLTGCASSGHNPHAVFDAWNGTQDLRMNCQSTPALCAKVQDAAQRYTRSGPFMPY